MKALWRTRRRLTEATDNAIARHALQSGIAAGTAAAAVAGWRAAAEGSTVLAPINAVTHRLWPRHAFHETGFSPRYTLTGFAIHQASAVFWATLFEAIHARLNRGARRADPIATVTAATATAATAYVIDYHMVPDRLTPGFDEHLSNRSLTGVYIALAAGLAGAALLRGR
jgi:hypothetical protein